ncbi:MAG: beta-ketoacyl-[acyl-carrier-protein] synthase II, partial [Deltaproteobacteria bacterium]|nr:beta-ketoacyl-[acyl-carrier-protein] synthase II [Deltaproteobacteria bacterium]
MTRRVVVTGVGMVTPLGTGVEKNWESACAGKSGIGPVTKFDVSDFPSKIAGEVPDFRSEDFLDKQQIRRF